MGLKTFVASVVVALMAVATSACSADGIHGLIASHHEPSQQKADPISGEWDASFTSEDDHVSFIRTLKLKLDGEKVTGTFESGHTGSGTIKGSWAAHKLNLTLESEQGSMSLIALLKEDKLIGEWEVSHMSGKVKAQKK